MSASPVGEPPPTSADDTLALRIARGDRAAESDFCLRYERAVRTLVRRHCRPGEPAVDDIAQDVLRSVLERLRAGAVRNEDALPAYIRSAVVFSVQAEYRKRTRHQEVAMEPGAEPVDPADPPQAAQRAQLAGTVRRLLDELPVPRDREVLRRFYLLEEDSREICSALGIDPGHFRRVMFRARERLRVLLTEAGLEHAT